MDRLRLWLLFYALTMAACLVMAGLLPLRIPAGTRYHAGIAIRLIVCDSGQCFPDNIWDRWILQQLDKN